MVIDIEQQQQAIKWSGSIHTQQYSHQPVRHQRMYRAEVKDQFKIQHLHHGSVARPIEPVRLGAKTQHIVKTAASYCSELS